MHLLLPQWGVIRAPRQMHMQLIHMQLRTPVQLPHAAALGQLDQRAAQLRRHREAGHVRNLDVAAQRLCLQPGVPQGSALAAALPTQATLCQQQAPTQKERHAYRAGMAYIQGPDRVSKNARGLTMSHAYACPTTAHGNSTCKGAHMVGKLRQLYPVGAQDWLRRRGAHVSAVLG